MTEARTIETLRHGILAGMAGGLAEVAWVMLYAAASGDDASIVARGVTTAAGISALLPAAPVAIGVAVHMTLAIGLGVVAVFAFEALQRRWPAIDNPYSFMLAALAGVWAINFFVVLPVVSPGFVGIVPYAVSLISKLLFGAAAATTMRHWTKADANLRALPVHARSQAPRDAPR